MMHVFLLLLTTLVCCSKGVGYQAVYRLYFVVMLFFILMSILMYNVKSSQDPLKRAAIQNGFWGIKYLIIIVCMIGVFWIHSGTFGDIWMYFGLTGGFFFILLQFVMINNFAHSWAETWNMTKALETDSKGWQAALITCTSPLLTALMFTGTVAAIVLMFGYYTGASAGQCKLHEFFISFNMLICLAIFFFSIISKSLKSLKSSINSILLKSSLISVYIMYLTWSAVSSSNYDQCKPQLSNSASDVTTTRFHSENIVDLVIWFLYLLYSSISTSDSGSGGDVEAGDARENEEEEVAYSWSLFHVKLGLATLYVMMCLTNWYNPSVDISSYSSNPAIMWVKIISSWLTAVIYLYLYNKKEKKNDRENQSSIREKEEAIREKESELEKEKEAAIRQKESDLEKNKQTLINSLTKTIKEKEEAIREKESNLECPVCLETAGGQIFSCTEQHLVCSQCRPRLEECPQCRQPYPPNPIRHRYAEKSVGELEKLRKDLGQMVLELHGLAFQPSAPSLDQDCGGTE